MPLPARSSSPAVRHLPLAIASTPPERRLELSDTATPADLRAEIARLRRQLTDHQVRMASYIHALNRTLNGQPVEVSHVTCAAAPNIIALARALELQRRAPVIRFMRDVRGQLTEFLELAVIVPDAPVEAHLDTLPAGMACIAGEGD